MTRGLCAGAVVVLAAVSLAAACAPGGGTGTALLPTPLPDLAALAPSVQTQLRDAHARLGTLARGPASVAERGAAFGELGRLLLAAQFPDAPEACFRNAETLAPRDPRWPYYLGHVHRQRGEIAPAVAAFERALALAPADVATLVWLGELQLQLGNAEAATSRFTAALAAQPGSLSARFGLGRAALARGDHAGAIAHLEAVLAADATAAAAHYPLSLAYRAAGDTTRADRHLARRANHEILPADPLMVELDTLLESAQSYETRGIRALERGDGAAAAAAFRRGLELAPEQASLHHRLGAALGLSGDRRGARAEYERAVQLSPDQFLAHYSLGLLEQADGRHAAAVPHFRAALAARPSYIEARVRLAASLRRTGRAGEALEAYRQALDDQPGLPEAAIGYAMTLVQLGRHREARRYLETARASAAEAAPLTHALARLLAAAPDPSVRDGARAREIVETLVAGGRSLDLGETMAMALAELGEYPRAVAVQRDLVTAASRAGLAPVVARLTANLERYQRRLPCRVPWTEAEWP